MNRGRLSFLSLPSISPMLGSGPDAEHPKGAHLRRSRTSQPMRSPHPGGGTEKLPMAEPARTEMQLMRASCWRKTATCPMRGYEQQVWKAERPLGSGAGLGAQRQRASTDPWRAPVAARHGPCSPAPRHAGRAPRCRRYRRRRPAQQNRCGKNRVGF